MPLARRKAFIEALIFVDNADLSDKLGVIEEHIQGWIALSPALRDALPDLAMQFARHHPHDLIGPSWETNMGWRNLTGVFGAGATDIALEVIAALGDDAQDVGGDSWLALAAHLAPTVSMAALGTGLERFLPLSEATLPHEVAGGPWTPALTPPEGAVETSAGLIWSRLGAVEAADRWRAAHALRRLAELERFDVIDAIVARFDTDGGAFRDQSLPFYRMHAQLWLLIALARIARDRPAHIARYRQILERIAFGDGLPHVVMRAFAGEALGAYAKTLDSGPRADFEAKLKQVNRSPFALSTERPTGPIGRYAKRPEGETRPEPHFGIEYDFGKYQIAPLGDRFGLPDYAIEDAVSAVVRGWAPGVGHMFDCPRRGQHDHGRGGATSGVPASDRYGSYLGWHGLMVVAGQYLATRPVYAYSHGERAWEGYLERFLLSRSDGYWLSDLTGFTPFDIATPLPMPQTEDDDFLKPEDARLLSNVLGLENGKLLARPLIVEGYWPLEDGVTIQVASILADRRSAEAAMIAAVTVEQSQTWLPATDDDLDYQVKRSRSEVFAWLREGDDGGSRLDRHDPYAASTGRNAPAPSDMTVAVLGLVPDDSRELVWRDRSEQFLTAEFWGGESKGDDRERSGERLFAEPAILQKLLHRLGKNLVGLVKAEQYIPSSQDVEKSRRAYRTMAFTIDPEGKVRVLTRMSAQMRAKLATISAYDRSEFYARYQVFRWGADTNPDKRGVA
ncbi:hypothetical protein CA833_20870 [Novosphingobium sp. KA1]|nr:hypothetical protein CA833_20870 [Novosphingobium sp. KA1]